MEQCNCPLCKTTAIYGSSSVLGFIHFECSHCKSVRIDEYSLRWLQGADQNTLNSLSEQASKSKEGELLVIERNIKSVQTDGRNGVMTSYKPLAAN